MTKPLLKFATAAFVLVSGTAAPLAIAMTQQAEQSATTAADPNAGVPTGAVRQEPAMVPAPAGVPHDPAAPIGSAANPVVVGGNITPPPTTPKNYPPCSRTVQDSCINPGERG